MICNLIFLDPEPEGLNAIPFCCNTPTKPLESTQDLRACGFPIPPKR